MKSKMNNVNLQPPTMADVCLELMFLFNLFSIRDCLYVFRQVVSLT